MTYIPKSPRARAMMERKLALQAAEGEAAASSARVPAVESLGVGGPGGRAGQPEAPAFTGDHESEGEEQNPPLSSAPACVGAGIADRGVVADAEASDEIRADDQGSHHPQTRCGEATSATPSEEEGADDRTALLPQTHFTDTTATSSLGHHTIFTPQAQGAFLASLAYRGNVRLACRAASVSAQTVYRARRRSAGFARAWDAALASARVVAEDALADRALDGWEEPVFYHGEEIARRRRYSDRLLLAHLARLDAVAAREGVAEGLAVLDDQIEALGRGEALEEVVPVLRDDISTSSISPQDERSLRDDAATSSASPQDDYDQDPVPSVPSCRECGGRCDDPAAHAAGELGPEDCQWFGNRLERMHAARPLGVKQPHELAQEMVVPLDGAHPDPLDLSDEVEALQLEAFEADGHEWWLVTTYDEMMASCTFSG
ncbi:hypothetical protein QWY75_02540 [Pontixanthobacter aestiaquae]|uniref:Homeodomain-like domain-containing protein n=1 Tax=Pontixanthobacter aestiaquae TaxID=1509367 RepID=A0A844Z7X9_9SPHN|nr:hypothetical protein [Pontixanthobacter aestiaquae]MDN3645082.1 hypothetical protein [Pontixanthobacter aestiaquae]MXO83918.1 hypothetical protein [Pontixanthobacter aestiaquae]